MHLYTLLFDGVIGLDAFEPNALLSSTETVDYWDPLHMWAGHIKQDFINFTP